MTDREYAVKSMKEITFQMAEHCDSHLEKLMDKHYGDIRHLMYYFQKLILENRRVLEDLEMECREKIQEDMSYALEYLNIYSRQLDVPKLAREMDNLMMIYGLSDLVHRGIILVKYYAPKGTLLSEVLYACFCSGREKRDVEVQQELGLGKTTYYKMKKLALRYLGFYFYEIVLPQTRSSRFKPSLGMEEE